MALFIGLMSGTSLDGVDAALVDCDTSRPPQLLAAQAATMPDALRERLLALCHADQASFADLAVAEDAFCRVQAEAVSRLLEKSGTPRDAIVAIGSHGQTIEHAPYGHDLGIQNDAGPAYTWQMDNPSLLAELTGCHVVGDFRRRDLAAGGQAAPLAPAFHDAVFRGADEWRLALNLGGFANLTLLPPAEQRVPVIGFDTGPANVLMDAWYGRHRGGRYDPEGAWAASGQVIDDLLDFLLREPFFHQSPPRSTGREVFHLTWLERHLSGQEAKQDVQATLAELTATSIALGIQMACELVNAPAPATLIPCGGGAHNIDLLSRLARHLPETALVPSTDWGWPEDWLEAGAFAWLAHRRLEGLPGNLPSVTGAAGPRVLGGVYAP